MHRGPALLSFVSGLRSPHVLGVEMKSFGLVLRKPNFWEITLTAAGCALLLAMMLGVCLIFGYAPDTTTKIVFSVSLAWGSLCSAFGVRMREGERHVSLLFGGCVLVNIVALALSGVIAS